jgi:UDP-GlcNAc:undecaprenyl-phosphate GlcNAc-1-phosphate transferase
MAKECLLKLELPLMGKNKEKFGILRLIKDLERDVISQYTLRRVESLRRTIIRFLEKNGSNSKCMVMQP